MTSQWDLAAKAANADLGRINRKTTLAQAPGRAQTVTLPYPGLGVAAGVSGSGLALIQTHTAWDGPRSKARMGRGLRNSKGMWILEEVGVMRQQWDGH